MLGGAVRGALSMVTGGLSDRVADIVEGVVGEQLPPDKKAELRLALERETTERERVATAAASDAERNLTDRIAQLEGTAADLRAIPFLGPIILFLRGCQRPAWGFAVMFMDWKVFSASGSSSAGWSLPADGPITLAFLAINVLVLGFLFGERALKNVAPLIAQFLGTKKPA